MGHQFDLTITTLHKDLYSNTTTITHISMCVKRSTEAKAMHASANYEVFLGGTCGQSTWRRDIAIPHLQSSGVTFFNPQQDDWHQGMIQMEREAIETSEVLLFVIKNDTRGIVSLMEVVYYAGRIHKNNLGQKLVVALEKGPPDPSNKQIDPSEHISLSSGRNRTRELLEKLNVPVFSSLVNALEETVRILKTQNVSSLTENSTKVQSVCCKTCKQMDHRNVKQSCKLSSVSTVLDVKPSISGLITATHQISLQKTPLLVCVQPVQENSMPNKNALKDYERGRAYLFDFALREGFSTFESIDEARQYAESQASNNFAHGNNFSIQDDSIQCI